MEILFYRYGSICEPALLRAFKQLNISVIEETTEINDKNVPPARCATLVNEVLKEHHPIFVFSINFYPAIAEVCHIYQTPYVFWTVDSPVVELFSNSLLHATNRAFLFDGSQYRYFHPYNEDNIYHLPLASDVEHFDSVIQTITEEDRQRYTSEISFVGSLYNEKNLLNKFTLSDYAKGYISGLVQSSLEIYGYNPIEDSLSAEIVAELRPYATIHCPFSNTLRSADEYIIAHSFIGMQAAEVERIRTLNILAEQFRVDLYTRSNTDMLHNVRVRGGIKTLTEMPKAFHLSKINLNMTIKPIQTGLPLRIFDILGCGGFLMTNYQEELTDHFQIGVDLESYSSMDELVDKCRFYLEHEELRRQIALNGYNNVKNNHTYQQRLLEMLRTITQL